MMTDYSPGWHTRGQGSTSGSKNGGSWTSWGSTIFFFQKKTVFSNYLTPRQRQAFMQILYNAHSHTYKYSPRKIPPCWPKTHMFYSQETSRNNYGNSLVNVSILSRLWYNSCSGEILFTDQIYRKFLHWEISPGHLAGQQSKVIFSYWELE